MNRVLKELYGKCQTGIDEEILIYINHASTEN
jgi:hypothetical protein